MSNANSRSFELPRQCRQVVFEKVERVLPGCRDALGVIDTEGLTLGVMAAMDDEDPAMAEWTRRESYAWSIHELVRYYIRTSKSSYVVQHLGQVEPEREAKKRTRDRQRRMVTFRNDAGEIVTKDRLTVTKAEVPMVIRDYRAREEANRDVVRWFADVFAQMELLGLGDNALVGDVVSLAPDDAEDAA